MFARVTGRTFLFLGKEIESERVFKSFRHAPRLIIMRKIYTAILLLMIAFYCSFPVIRSPNSTFAIWTSLVPFFSPLVMPVRMAINMPPLWQIAVSILLEVVTILSLTWLAAKTYRIGILMYGKRATIPEVLRWLRQS
jgi:ABC-2 type transport system permease protein